MYETPELYQTAPNTGPSAMDFAQNAMNLKQMGMHNQQMQLQMQQQQAMRDAYQKNTGADGKLNQQGFLSDLGRANPQGAMEYQGQFNKMNKEQAEAQSAQLAVTQMKQSLVAKGLLYVNSRPQQEQPKVYEAVVKSMFDNGIAQPAQPGQPPQPGTLNPNFNPQEFQGIVNRAQMHLGAQTPSYLADQKTQAETAKTQAETAKTESETYKRNPDIAGKTDDPAKLVPGYVPKEHQAKALEEIKNAQDINALSPKIMAAFKMGSSRNPVTAAQGQREFEALINTTVKDTEGTARQAAFDSIHRTMTPSGLTASPGENEAKARTVMEYLQSKASAPTAKAFRIDLSKYPSTAPYQAPQMNDAPQGGGQGMVSSAYAATLAPKDMEAIHWAQRNANDPRAQKILQLHGMK